MKDQKITSASQLTLSDIDVILVNDITTCLDSLPEMKKDVFVSRWGIGKNRERCQEIAVRNGASQRMVHATYSEANKSFLKSLSVDSVAIKRMVYDSLSVDVRVLMPTLFGMFCSELMFFKFIEMVCRARKGEMEEIFLKTINREILNYIFCQYQSPIVFEVFVGEVIRHHGYNGVQAYYAIINAYKNDQINLTKEGVYPKKLDRREAIAHALLPYPDGLNFKDVVKIINDEDKDILKSKKDLGLHGFKDSEWVYLCGVGTYRHIMYLSLDEFDIPGIMRRIKAFFKDRNIRSFYLNDFFYHDKKGLKGIDYYALRYIVSKFGNKYGIYFNGASSTDSVSVDQNAKNLSQIDFIENAIIRSDKPLSVEDLTAMVKCNNSSLVYQYTKKLIKKGSVLKNGKGMYCKASSSSGSLENVHE